MRAERAEEADRAAGFHYADVMTDAAGITAFLPIPALLVLDPLASWTPP